MKPYRDMNEDERSDAEDASAYRDEVRHELAVKNAIDLQTRIVAGGALALRDFDTTDEFIAAMEVIQRLACDPEASDKEIGLELRILMQKTIDKAAAEMVTERDIDREMEAREELAT